VYLREDALTDPLDTWLASAFAPDHIAQTITAMADAQPLNHSPTTGTAAQAIITECDAKLERYRAALDAGADPAVVTGSGKPTPNAPAQKPNYAPSRVPPRAG